MYASLRRRLLTWYGGAGRDLPWRRTRDPYAVLVSEVMLQQTQAGRVVPAYTAFLARYPTLDRLASAPLADVLRAWAGLGYNRRARDLHRAARAARNGLPRTREALDALPGVGPYTAGAVACFAYGHAEPFADTNIRRVLGRALLGRDAREREAAELDRAAMPARDPARWHHALMDLGATVCVARSPRCGRCPIAPVCVARSRGAVPAAERPRQAAFGPSDRRVRGAIVAALRDAPEGLTVRRLARAIGDERVPRLVAALETDGLVERAGRRTRLPS
ncbi:MAG TPA: A/G-specific adenine glycosylase [Candidatus Limnocylindria bacterium]|nr:A/G-specific adenine glycosylase [Candidatus Limnocylindria bacterium]